jgi:hypothetical protein
MMSLLSGHSFKCLGINFSAGAKQQLDCSHLRRQFHTAVNSVLCRCKYVDGICTLASSDNVLPSVVGILY